MNNLVNHTAKYIGNELELFEQAKSWKTYFGSFIKPLLGKEVAEIGAGIGGTTAALCNGEQDLWLCVEPDPALAEEIRGKIQKKQLPSVCKAVTAYATDLEQQFDSILYIDVIEHIEDDKAELATAAALLKKDGRLFVLVPAHQKLYSPFDKQIGHFRRYSRSSLQSKLPASLRVEEINYLDSVGYFASLANKAFLKQSLPTAKQVLFWDRYIIPVSRIIDRLTGFHFGKSLLLIAKKN